MTTTPSENFDQTSMRRKKMAAAIALACIGAAIFVFTLIHSLWYAPESEVAIKSSPIAFAATGAFASSTTKVSLDLPDRLVIPAIHVDAYVQHVGITWKGNMGVPNNYTDVGWYKYGTVPGAVGSAVIDGHVDNGLGTPGVFIDLPQLTAGDDIYVYTASGQKLHFVVVDTELYYYKSAPLHTIFNQTDVPRLNLITCQGDWVAQDQTDDHRLVVYTKLVQ